MKLTITKEKRRFLLWLPLVAFPFLCLVFYTLGGGRGSAKDKKPAIMGLNTQLPPLPFDLQKAFQDKLKTYEQVDNDSLRKAQYQRQDPYHKDSVTTSVTTTRRQTPSAKPAIVAPFADPRAGQLEQQLARLQQSLHQKQPVFHPAPPPHYDDAASMPDKPAPDPQIDRLNAMLDKVIRIQHPQEQPPATPTPPAHPADEVLPADTNANSIAAIIPEDQTLTTGVTIALRITDSIRISGRTLSAGELVYGTVTLNNDRLLVHIGSLREGRNLYTTDWQVYDLDGLPGIHIPGMIGRDVAKQSADQGVNALNVMTLDPSLGAQAAGAGIQAAKTFLGRNVRQVRVTVRAGYQVLLRNPRASDSRQKRPLPPAIKTDSIQAPGFEPGSPVLVHCRTEGMELRLRHLLIRDSCLWFGVEWRNHSPIVYTPAYARWYIRDRRVFRRTALQEQTLEPVYPTVLPIVGNDSAEHSFTGFRPFALAKDKELVLEVGEKGGGRTLILVIPSKQILKAKNDEKGNQP
ncbi:MAG TPA: conjugative transposon protein TraM [Puia sp.]|nr:conjugative transposon protein TraM [Puia sp.]